MNFQFKWRFYIVEFKKNGDNWERTLYYTGRWLYEDPNANRKGDALVFNIEEDIKNDGLVDDYRNALKVAYEEWKKKEKTKNKLGI